MWMFDMSSGSYDWAIQYTETRWQVHACNRSTATLKITEHVQKQTVRVLSKKQQNKQMSHGIYEMLNDSTEEGEYFRTYLNVGIAKYEEAKVSRARLTLAAQRKTAKHLTEPALSLNDRGKSGENKRKETGPPKKKSKKANK
jgi:hypothetical protein